VTNFDEADRNYVLALPILSRDFDFIFVVGRKRHTPRLFCPLTHPLFLRSRIDALWNGASEGVDKPAKLLGQRLGLFLRDPVARTDEGHDEARASIHLVKHQAATDHAGIRHRYG